MEHAIHAAHFMDRVLDPLAACLNREAAVSIVDLRIDPEIQARVEVLAERANEGTLTPDERAEYLSYVEAADLLAIFKLKAKRHLEANGGADKVSGTGFGYTLTQESPESQESQESRFSVPDTSWFLTNRDWEATGRGSAPGAGKMKALAGG